MNKQIAAIVATAIIAIVSLFKTDDIRIVFGALIIISGLGGFAVWQSWHPKS